VSPPPTVPYLPAGYPVSDSISSPSSGGLTNDTELSEFGDVSPSWLADSLPDLAAVCTITLGPPLHSVDELGASSGINPPPFISRGMQADAPEPAPVDAPVMINAEVDAPAMVDAAADARRIPAPVLEPPAVVSAVLAERAAQNFFIDFDASLHVIAERLLATVPDGMSPGQWRAVELAIRFSADVHPLFSGCPSRDGGLDTVRHGGQFWAPGGSSSARHAARAVATAPDVVRSCCRPAGNDHPAVHRATGRRSTWRV